VVSRRNFLGGLGACALWPSARAAGELATPPAAAVAGSMTSESHAGHAGHAERGGRTGRKVELGAAAAFDAAGGAWAVCKEGEHVVLRQASGPGQPWSAPRRVNAMPEAIAADGDSRPKIALGPRGELFVTWTRPLAKPYTGEIRFARSLDGGASFSAPQTVHVDRQEITHRFDALAVAAGGEVVVAWIDKRDLELAKAAGAEYRGAAVYFAVSSDQGRSFRGDFKLAEHSCECCRIALQPLPDGSVVALWRHVFESGVRDHALARFWPDGRSEPMRRATFEDWRIDACPHHGPSLALDGEGRLHAVWFGDGAVRYGSLGHAQPGRTSAPSGLRKLGGASAEHADLAIAGREIVVAWREFDGVAMSLKAQRSRDGGASWQEMTLASSGGPTGHPFVLERQGRFFVFWHTRDEALRIVEMPAS
jgi:hypothetical protein